MKCCHWLHRLMAFGVLLAASTVPALAADDDAEAAQRHEALFKQLDTNGDGELSTDEMGSGQQRMFKRLIATSDKNSDGKLSREEFLAGTKDAPPPREPGRGGPGRGGQGGGGQGGGVASPEQLEMIFKQLDANGDGKLVIEEVPEERRPRFEIMIQRADADGDKSLTLIEFTKGMAMMRGGQQAGAGGSQGQSRQPMMPGMGPGEAVFRALDTNSDGKLSKDEIYSAPKSLEKLDRNGDGEITRQELGGPRPDGQGGRPGGQFTGDGKAFFRRMDANGDGKLSKDEAPERMKENFDRIDTNGDGFIDEAEFSRVMQGMARRPGGAGAPGEGRPQQFDPKQMLKRLDANGDGKLSKDELPERMRENFDRIDANSDGFVEADELERAMAGMNRNRQGQPGGRRPPPDGDNKDNQ